MIILEIEIFAVKTIIVKGFVLAIINIDKDDIHIKIA